MKTVTPAAIRVVIAARATVLPSLREALASAGMDVAADCGDGAELLAAVSREHPDVCVLDRELRGGGLAIAAAATSPARAPKVIVIGGRGSSAERRAARLAGAAECLPFDTAAVELAAAVTSILRK